MKATTFRNALAATAALILYPASAVAQEDVKERVEELADQANAVQEQAGELANDVAAREDVDVADNNVSDRDVADDERGDDDDFDWGILGLLGLAGLAGLRRRDDHRVHTDDRVRTDVRP